MRKREERKRCAGGSVYVPCAEPSFSIIGSFVVRKIRLDFIKQIVAWNISGSEAARRAHFDRTLHTTTLLRCPLFKALSYAMLDKSVTIILKWNLSWFVFCNKKLFRLV
jgi:hypothetical protein